LIRALYRPPILLYRARLGWLLGGRFMLIEHTGRRSGRTRRTVVEVVEHVGSDGSYVVASGFGPEADWYRNLLAHPDASVQVGRYHGKVHAEPLTAAEGGRVLIRYAYKHRIAARQLCQFMGYEVDGSDSDYRAVGEHIPFLRLTPQPCPL
jgi:deazaflavin-dependent oxidoreductase (nitroreductase family)